MEGIVNDKINLTFPAKGEYISLARLTTSSVASKEGFNIDDIEDLKVSIGEACNIILENTSISSEQNIVIDYMVDVEALNISIKARKENGLDISEINKEENFSVMIIDSLMDDVELSSEGDCMSVNILKKKRL